MNNLIQRQSLKILRNIKEVFTYFDNSAISDSARDSINELINIVNNKTRDEDVDLIRLYSLIQDFNTDIDSAIYDTLMRSRTHYYNEIALERESVCNLFKARVNTLIIMLESRL